MALTLEWARELGRKCGGALYEKQNGSGPGSDLIASDRQVEGGGRVRNYKYTKILGRGPDGA